MLLAGQPNSNQGHSRCQASNQLDLLLTYAPRLNSTACGFCRSQLETYATLLTIVEQASCLQSLVGGRGAEVVVICSILQAPFVGIAACLAASIEPGISPDRLLVP